MRLEACGVLVVSYLGQDDCLQTIADDSEELPKNRQEALRELNRVQKQTVPRRRLLETLNDPAMPTYLRIYDDSEHRIREELETILLGADVPLRERACAALKRYYPYDPEPECSRTRNR